MSLPRAGDVMELAGLPEPHGQRIEDKRVPKGKSERMDSGKTNNYTITLAFYIKKKNYKTEVKF